MTKKIAMPVWALIAWFLGLAIVLLEIDCYVAGIKSWWVGMAFGIGLVIVALTQMRVQK